MDRRRKALSPALDPLFGLTRNVMGLLRSWFNLSLTPHIQARIKAWHDRIVHRTTREILDHVAIAGLIAQELSGFGVPSTDNSIRRIM